MKTSIFMNRAKTTLLAITTLVSTNIVLSSCEEDITEDSIVGTYDSVSEEEGITTITISRNSANFSFKCKYESWESIKSRTGLDTKNIEWNGTFKEIPEDIVIDKNGEKIGEIQFKQNTDRVSVIFRAETKRKGTYKAQKDNEYSDIFPMTSK